MIPCCLLLFRFGYCRKAATRAEWRYTETGKKVRVLFPSGAIFNPPEASEVLADGVSPELYISK